MTNPLVSIIVPCFRQAHLLTAALQSLLKQSYQPIEIIVVNDGSDDNTEAVARHFGQQIHYVFKENGGLASARNAGIEEAKGQYLHFLDADDLLHPEAIERLVDGAQGTDDCVCVMGYRNFQIDPEKENEEGCLLPKEPNLLPALFHSNLGPPHCYLVSRRMVLEAGNFDESLSNSCEDWYLWLRLGLAAAKRINVPFVGAYYRRYPGSISTNSARMLEMKTKGMLKIHKQLIQNPVNLKAWGVDLVRAERRLRRRWIAQFPDSSLIDALSKGIAELESYGFGVNQSLPKRILDFAFGKRSEHLVVSYFRWFDQDQYDYYRKSNV